MNHEVRIIGPSTCRTRRASRAAPQVRTADLLIGLLDQRDNFAVRLLQTLEHDVEEIREAAQRADVDEPVPTAGSTAAAGEGFLWSGLTLPARVAIGAALEASIDLGHNYLGCEHLLLGLLGDATTGAGQVLHGVGLDSAALRRAIVSAAAGFVHARQNTPATETATLDRLTQRLDAIDRRLDAAGL